MYSHGLPVQSLCINIAEEKGVEHSAEDATREKANDKDSQLWPMVGSVAHTKPNDATGDYNYPDNILRR